MLITVFIACIGLGALVGFLAGLLGIGGGLVIVPALVYLFHFLDISVEIAMPMALATSLSSIVVTSYFAAYAHNRNQNIPWDITKKLMVVVAGGALLGATIAGHLSVSALKTIFSIAVILLASYMLASIKIKRTRAMPSDPILQIIGIATGVLASLMGIAGGAILVPALSYCGMSLRHTIGVATVCGMMVALFGSLGYAIIGFGHPDLPPWSLGYIHLPALLAIVITSSFFAPKGVKLAAKLPVDLLKKYFAVFLILVAIKMMVY
ncbi:sulfite exporter TauE/SafE family protein [Colwelliaceae bacterium 6471]